MRLKPKTVRRLTLLAVVLVLLAVGAVGLLVVRQWNRDRLLDERRAEGFQAFDRHDYLRAIDRIGPYLKTRGQDADALVRYCRARWRAEEADGRHASQAMHFYRQYLGMRPDDREAGVELMRIYNTVGGHQVEARELALRFRPPDLAQAGPEHVPVLREEIAALTATRDAAALDAALARLCELAPLDLDGQLFRLQRFVTAGRAAEAAEHARKLREVHPDDPRAAIIDACARAAADNRTVNGLAEDLARVLGVDPARPDAPASVRLPDEPSMLRVVTLLDSMGAFPIARAVLRTADDPVAAPMAFRIGIRRAWSNNAIDEVIRITDAADPKSHDSHSEVLGFRAAALAAAGRDEEARTLIETLGARRDFRATAWSTAAPHAGKPTLAPGQAVDALARAIAAHGREPVFHHARAEALAALNRAEEAVGELRLAAESPLSAGWAQPWTRLAQVSLQLGLVGEAVVAADRAAAIAPTSVPVAMTYLNARLARIERAAEPTDDERLLLRQIETIQARLQATPEDATEWAGALSDQLLPGRVLLLARTGRAGEASAVVRERLAADPPARDVLERLAVISLREKLGLESLLLDRAEQAHGPSASTAAVRALSLHGAGRTGEAIAVLTEGAAAAPAEQRREWAAARAVFLDQTGDPDAPHAWEDLAREYPDDPGIQESILRSRTAARVAGLLDAARERLIKLTGVDPQRSSVLRIARARALLTEPGGTGARDQAVPLLRAVINDHPQLIEPRLMLADALLAADPARGQQADVSGAITELRAAAAVAPESGPIALRIAELLQSRRDYDGARAELSRLARDPAVSSAVRRRAAQLLAAQGLHNEAIPAFESAAAEGGEPERLALAELYALARRDTEALALFRTLAEESNDPDRLVAVAVWLDRLGDPAAADAAAQRLAASAPAPVHRELLMGRCDAGRRRWASAAGHFRAATDADPAQADAWAALIEALIAAGQTDEAVAASARAREHHPADPRIAVAGQRAAAAAAGGTPDLIALAQAMAAEPGNQAAAAVVTAVEEARRSGALDREDGLAALADRFADNWAVQSLVISRLMDLVPPRTERATRLLDRATTAFPVSPEPARLAFNIYGGLGWWDRALIAAQEWQRRDPTRSFDALAAVAEARIRLDRPRGAWESLRSAAARAQQAPDATDSALALGLAARALIAADEADEAWTVIAPAIERSATARARVFVPLFAGGTLPARDVPAWLERAEKAFPAEPADRALLARACVQRAAREPDLRDALLTRADAILVPFADSAEPTVLIARAEVQRLRGDRPAARDAALRALEADPGSVDALETLARASAQDADGRSVLSQAAARCADHARDAGPWLVVARALMAEAEQLPVSEAPPVYRAALDAYQAVLATDPAQVEALAQGALAAERAGDDAAALRLYDAALALPNLSPRLRSAVQNNAAYFIATRASPPPDSLSRALTLARGAADAAPIPSYLDTLARVQRAMGDRPEAIQTYRRALSVQSDHTECILGLAELLAAGPAADHDEARRLLGRLAGDAVALTPAQTERAGRLRAALGL